MLTYYTLYNQGHGIHTGNKNKEKKRISRKTIKESIPKD